MKRTLLVAIAAAVVAGATGCGAARAHVAAQAPPAMCTHARQAHPASPAEIVQRFRSRLGDRRYIRSISFPASLDGRPLGSQLVAVVNDPLGGPWKGFSESNPNDWLTQMRASWEGGLVFGALRDDFCSAGGASSLVRTIGGGRTSADVWDKFAQRFRNPSPAAFRARVALVGRRFGFRVVSLRLLHPEQIAPLLIVKTNRPRTAFAKDLATILSVLDPTSRKPGAFEGFFFAAENTHGPFLLTDNLRRGGQSTDQWAPSEGLLPYSHA